MLDILGVTNPFKKVFWKVYFHCHNPSRIKLFTRLRPGFSQLCEHKFRYSFQDALDLIWSLGKKFENTTYYLLHCTDYINQRTTLLNSLQNVAENIFDRNN